MKLCSRLGPKLLNHTLAWLVTKIFFKDAISRRDSLGVQHRRAKAIENTTSRFDSVDAFDRMAEKMEGATDIDEARREVDLDLDPLAHRPVRDFAAERAARESNAEDMLEELKRRMEEGD